ncbi:RDD family protein [Christiangramia sp. SM2212]|uniref:RDD family protein n=1 Tax=Christiangramia sediminicola TaxID=3073267 RepID=A0ABU1ERJ1_9FLAO|nr:RDD family protein [Christiangramia sp. SM2212]MDR5591011.1 RDD family protein [Christiangramia sp. SM2212]
MANQFTKAMSERSDEQLIKITTTESHKYTSPALEAAEVEIKKRNIDQSHYDQVVDDLKIEDKGIKETKSNSVSSILRLVNYIIDIIVAYTGSFIIAMIISLIIPFDFIGFEIAGLILIIASFFTYYILMEVLFQKTLGKFITRTKVVTTNGNKPSELDIVTRTFCRLIPFDRISYLFTRNGFHDRLSNTKVIKDQPL